MLKALSTTVQGTTVASLMAVRLTQVCAVLSLVLLGALHLLSPEFDPSRRMVSEYALGSYAWVLTLMFLMWALSCVMLFFAIKLYVQHVTGKIGLGFLLTAALGMTMAAMFDVRHGLHGLAALLGIPSLPIAALLISTSLISKAPKRLALWTANLTWISLALMFATVFIGLAQSNGEFGPNLLIGWPNRLVVISYCMWLIAAARAVGQLQSQEP